ncbi:MAG: ABC transporter permease [Acidobacteria bacterium]|nr:ABC transporter permease [Acidobacteriota bacterium]MBV9436884.1 ABC transporter permease [Acidobacteriota bacterium]
MAIPISYNVRNLRLRLGATAMTALGIALTVSVAVFIMALLAGLRKAFVSSGDPLNVLVLRHASQTELQSGIDRGTYETIKYLPGIAKSKSGDPLASGEVVVVIMLPRNDNTGETNVTVRGMSPIGFELRPNIPLVEGRWFDTGKREIVVSKSIKSRFRKANIGDEIFFGKGNWKVVGVFDAGDTASSSEIWADVNQMAADFERNAAFSSVLVHATDPVAAQALKNRMQDDQRLALDALSETDYYANQTKSGQPIQFVGTVVAIIMAVGSCFAAMNTMYAAVAYRSREIATLRILGFSRPSIITSFVLESVLLALLGAAVGLVLMAPLNGMTTGTGNNVTFSETVFAIRITLNVIVTAIIFAVTMGVFGGIAPAWHASRREILAALRD